jgi:hypothetical protein
MNAWLRKELRDAIRWAPLGIAALALVMWYVLRSTTWGQMTQISQSLMFPVLMVCAIYATFLGLITFLPDMRENARSFLIHRGLEPSRIFHIRMAVGVSVFLASVFVPLCVTTIYLAAVGPNRMPTMPIQILPSLMAALLCISFYFAGIVAACRPSRWFGTRLLPLCFALLMSLGCLAFTQVSYPYWSFWFLAPCLIGMLVLYRSSLSSFLKGTSRPIVSRKNSSTLSERVLFVGATTMVAMIACLIVSMFYIPVHPGGSTSERFMEDGAPWLVRWGNDFRVQPSAVVPMLPSSGASDPSFQKKEIPSVKELLEPEARFQVRTNLDNGLDMRLLYDHSSQTSKPSSFQFYAYGGCIYVYENYTPSITSPRLLGIIGNDTVVNPDEAQPAPFGSSVLLTTANCSLQDPLHFIMYVVVSDGVYVVDWDQQKSKRTVNHVFQKAVSYFGLGSKDELCLGTQEGIYIVPKSAAGEFASYDLSHASLSLSIPQHELKLFDNMYLYQVNESNWTFVSKDPGWFSSYHVVRSTSAEGQPLKYSFDEPAEWSSKLRASYERSMIPVKLLCPPGYLSFVMVATDWLDGEGSMPKPLWVEITLQAIFGAGLAFLAALRRRRSSMGLLLWALVGGFFGLATWIAVLAIYPRVVLVACPHCKTRRTLDQEQCPSCNAAWEPPAPLGIEAIEPVGGAIESQPAMAIT